MDGLPIAAVDYLSESGFCFPIRSEGEIERLEAAVRSDMYMRSSYIQFLHNSKKPDTPIRRIFQMIFYDEALVNYNYNGVCNVPSIKKRAMKDYFIFRDCFLAAWQEFGVTDDMVRTVLMELIRNINSRRRNRHYKERMRKKEIQRRHR